jgi:hypothetical protein
VAEDRHHIPDLLLDLLVLLAEDRDYPDALYPLPLLVTRLRLGRRPERGKGKGTADISEGDPPVLLFQGVGQGHFPLLGVTGTKETETGRKNPGDMEASGDVDAVVEAFPVTVTATVEEEALDQGKWTLMMALRLPLKDWANSRSRVPQKLIAKGREVFRGKRVDGRWTLTVETG